MWFTQVSLRNPVFATMMMAALVVMGLFSFAQLKIDHFPQVEYPVVVVITDYPGAPPAVVENDVSRPIEEAVNSIAGISALSSRSYDGQSVVMVKLELHMDGRKAADDVRERVASVRPLLSPQVKEPRVLRFDTTSRAVWSVAVVPDQARTTATQPVELSTWAQQVLKKRLENVRGVGAVNLIGGSRREIHVDLQPAAMQSLGITSDQVAAAVRSENQEQPLGALRDRQTERMVQLDARAKRPEDLGSLTVARRATQVIRLDQLARISDGAQELDSLALYDGERTLILSVQKAQEENTIDVIDRLNAVVQGMASELPPGVRLAPIMDASREIRVAVTNVRQSLFEGAALTVLIVFLFLNSWRSTVITGLTLPIALIGTFFFMRLCGFSINMITLMALSLCVGLLIDDAIVVRENIVRHMQMGKSAYQAALDGTQEIALAVLATTFSIVAVFLPIGFMGGIIGRFFHQFGLTVAAAVLISMFVSFTLDPMLSSVWHDPPAGSEPRPRRLHERALAALMARFARATEALSDYYQIVLRAALAHKLRTLSMSIALFALGVVLIPRLGTELLPRADMSEILVQFHTPSGAALTLTEAKAQQVQSIVREIPEVRHSLALINAEAGQGRNGVTLYVALIERRARKRSADDIAAALRQRLTQVAAVTVTHVGLPDPVGGGKQIELSLTGPGRRELTRLASLAIERIRPVRGLVDLDSSQRADRPTLSLQLRPEAASSAGLPTTQLAGHLRTLIAGQVVGQWRAPDDQTYEVIARLAPQARELPQQVERLPVVVGTHADGSARVMALGQLAQVTESASPSQINRRDMAAEVTISANAFNRSAGQVAGDIRYVMQSIDLPPGYRWRFTGATREMGESFNYAIFALTLAVVFIYMILASQFKSFVQPLALMASLPLTLIGVVAALMAFGSTLSILSAIGIVMLMGLVTKNAILLIDFTQRARAEGLEREAALLQAAQVRLRPILMTTLAMIFGMVPLAFGLSEGSEQRAPMAQAIIGGLVTSSLLTLVVVPVIYCLLDEMSQRWRRGRVGAAPLPDAAAAMQLA